MGENPSPSAATNISLFEDCLGISCLNPSGKDFLAEEPPESFSDATLRGESKRFSRCGNKLFRRADLAERGVFNMSSDILKPFR